MSRVVWAVGVVRASITTSGDRAADEIIMASHFEGVMDDWRNDDVNFYIHAAPLRVLAHHNRVGRCDHASLS